MNKIKRVATIHDLSGFGRCSLSVILPTLSIMGVQCCPIPTAVLSTHTGGLGEPVACDLSDYLTGALNHYQSLGVEFDCIYSGYLGSTAQIDHCLDYIKVYHEALVVVDPVMGDHGKLYKSFSSGTCKRMSELVAMADMITPNLTEAALLLGEHYPQGYLTQSVAKSWLVKLSKLGPNYVIITGVSMSDGVISNIGYEAEKNAFWRVDCDYIPIAYPGTGDIFASIMVGSSLNGDSLPIAMGRATTFLELAIKTTYSYKTDTRHGVMLEKALPYLTENRIFKNYHVL